MELAGSGSDDSVRRYGVTVDGWSLQDKSAVVQLQAADIWAWENYKYAIDCFFAKPEERKKPRASYRALRDSPTEVRYHNKRTLQELVRRLNAGV
jgi:hypothetical protein